MEGSSFGFSTWLMRGESVNGLGSGHRDPAGMLGTHQAGSRPKVSDPLTGGTAPSTLPGRRAGTGPYPPPPCHWTSRRHQQWPEWHGKGRGGVRFGPDPGIIGNGLRIRGGCGEGGKVWTRPRHHRQWPAHQRGCGEGGKVWTRPRLRLRPARPSQA